MGTRFTPEQFGNAERAGAPRKESSFGDKRAWRDYQERWFKALKPDETLAEEGAERTKAWKAATRQYGQIEAARLRLSSESIEVTANVSVRNRLHVSNHWLRTKAPELTDVQLATPVATPTEQHVVRRLRARVSTEVGPQSCEDAVVYSVPPAAETDGAAERRKDRHRKREEVVLHRLAAGSSAQVAWGETSTDSAGWRAFHPRPFGIAPVAWKADSLSDELKPCTWDFGAGCWRTADGEEYSVEKNARRDAERLKRRATCEAIELTSLGWVPRRTLRPWVEGHVTGEPLPADYPWWQIQDFAGDFRKEKYEYQGREWAEGPCRTGPPRSQKESADQPSRNPDYSSRYYRYSRRLLGPHFAPHRPVRQTNEHGYDEYGYGVWDESRMTNMATFGRTNDEYGYDEYDHEVEPGPQYPAKFEQYVQSVEHLLAQAEIPRHVFEMILLKIAHERNDKAERLAELEYFKEKEQRERYENALFRQERVSYEELRAVAMLDAEFEVHAHKVAMIALFLAVWRSRFGDHERHSRASRVWDMRLVRSSRFWALLDDVRVALPACVHRHRVSIGSAQVVTDPGLRSLQQTFTLLPSYKTNDDNIFWQHKTTSGVLFADFVKNGSAELGFMRPRNECTELFAEHTYSPEHTYSECLSSCSSPVQPIHPEQGLHPSARIDGRHELRCYSTVAPAVGSYQLIFAWSDCESSNMDFDSNMDFGKLLAKLVSL